MIYKLNKNTTLEGSLEEITTALLSDELKPHLYHRDRIDILDPDRAQVHSFYKTRENLCPTCGSIHGRKLALISSVTPHFKSNFAPKVCSACRKGLQEELPEWVGMREYEED